MYTHKMTIRSSFTSNKAWTKKESLDYGSSSTIPRDITSLPAMWIKAMNR